MRAFLILLALLSTQAAFADEQQQLATQFNLSATITDGRPPAIPFNAIYFGYRYNPSPINDKTRLVPDLGNPSVYVQRNYELDQPGLACFDSIAVDGTRCRAWLDLKSERLFNGLYWYRTWVLRDI